LIAGRHCAKHPDEQGVVRPYGCVIGSSLKIPRGGKVLQVRERKNLERDASAAVGTTLWTLFGEEKYTIFWGKLGRRSAINNENMGTKATTKWEKSKGETKKRKSRPLRDDRKLGI